MQIKNKKEPDFFKRVYEIVKKVPKGKVITYGKIAEILETKDARRVGQALHANKDPKNIPCHRVVRKDGSLAPGYVFGGMNEQMNKLITEGVTFTKDEKVDNQDLLKGVN